MSISAAIVQEGEQWHSPDLGSRMAFEELKLSKVCLDSVLENKVSRNIINYDAWGTHAQLHMPE